MAESTEPMVAIYRKLAGHYDITANRFYAIGFRGMAYRKLAIRELRLKTGDTVVDAGCGTGLNFTLLRRAVGPSGRVVGVDLTDAMLAKARERVARHGWENVELVEADLARFEFPAPISGILASFSATLLPNYEELIKRGYAALAPGGRWAVVDYKLPGWWPQRMIGMLNPLISPFGGDVSMADRKPWELLAAHGHDFRMHERYRGFAYVASAAANGREPGQGNPIP
jgi:demethylmenaquinone methyltransferase/2-methoxy-6-polyprenyl-1,4-benzoquinol methylase